MKTRRERLLLVLFAVLFIYAVSIRDNISAALTNYLIEGNSSEVVAISVTSGNVVIKQSLGKCDDAVRTTNTIMAVGNRIEIPLEYRGEVLVDIEPSFLMGCSKNGNVVKIIGFPNDGELEIKAYYGTTEDHKIKYEQSTHNAAFYGRPESLASDVLWHKKVCEYCDYESDKINCTRKYDKNCHWVDCECGRKIDSAQKDSKHYQRYKKGYIWYTDYQDDWEYGEKCDVCDYVKEAPKFYNLKVYNARIESDVEKDEIIGNLPGYDSFECKFEAGKEIKLRRYNPDRTDNRGWDHASYYEENDFHGWNVTGIDKLPSEVDDELIISFTMPENDVIIKALWTKCGHSIINRKAMNGEWTKDPSGHWLQCSCEARFINQEVRGFEKHIDTKNWDGICDKCGFEMGHIHIESGLYESDKNGKHYKLCLDCTKIIPESLANCNYLSSGKCMWCSYIKPAPSTPVDPCAYGHNFYLGSCTVCGTKHNCVGTVYDSNSSRFWKVDNEEHYIECVCGNRMSGLKGSNYSDAMSGTLGGVKHTWDGKGTCEVCGYEHKNCVGTVYGDTSTNGWKVDNEKHYIECICGKRMSGLKGSDYSGAQASTPGGVEHNWNGKGSCSTCGYEHKNCVGTVRSYATVNTGWFTDLDYHWNECICGNKMAGDINSSKSRAAANTKKAVEHTFNDQGKCSVCGLKGRVVVTYDANSGTNAPSADKVKKGSSYTVSSAKPQNTGYVFTGWNTKKDETGVTYKIGEKIDNLETDIILYAQWENNCIILSFDPMGGTNAPEETYIVEGYPTLISKEIPIRDGYIFTGWNTKKDKTGTSYQPGDIVVYQEKDLVLYACWEDRELKIEYNANGGENAPNTTKTIPGVSWKLSWEKPTRTGFVFTGWNTKIDGTGEEYQAGDTRRSIYEDITLYAQWECIKHEGGDVYIFNETHHWVMCKNCNEVKMYYPGSKTEGMGTHTLSAGRCTMCGYVDSTANVTRYVEVEFNCGEGGKIDIPYVQKEFKVGTSKEIAVTPDEGYKISSITVNGVEQKITDENGMKITLTFNENSVTEFKFVKEEEESVIQQGKVYTISYNANGGKNAPESQVKEENVAIKISEQIPTKVGYEFVRWSGAPKDGNPTGAIITVNPGQQYTTNSNIELIAQWKVAKAKTYTISYNANGGKNAPESQVKEENVAIKISEQIPTKVGYEFVRWSGAPKDGNPTGAIITVNPGQQYTTNSNIELVAQWKEKKEEEQKVVTLTGKVNGKGGEMNPTGKQEVGVGTNHDFEITPDEGYVIISLKENGKNVTSDIIYGSKNTYKVKNIQVDTIIEVEFEEAQIIMVELPKYGNNSAEEEPTNNLYPNKDENPVKVEDENKGNIIKAEEPKLYPGIPMITPPAEKIENSVEEEKVVCEHKGGNVWEADNEGHYTLCQFCGEEKMTKKKGTEVGVVAHKWKNKNGKCSVCKFTHTHELEYTSTVTNHTATCKVCGFSVIKNKEHTLVNGMCNTCGYKVDPTTCIHKGGATYYSSPEGHYTLCQYCGIEKMEKKNGKTVGISEHKWKNKSGKCSICKETHTHELEYTSTEKKHTGTCKICQLKVINSKNHTFDSNGKCTVCEYTK